MWLAIFPLAGIAIGLLAYFLQGWLGKDDELIQDSTKEREEVD